MPTPKTTPIPPEIYPGPGHIHILENSFGTTLILQSTHPIPPKNLPHIHANSTTQPPTPIHWHQFPGANFYRSQNLNPLTLTSLTFHNPNTPPHHFPIPP